MKFFLLILGILLNLNPDTDHKYSRFFETLFKKSLEFISNKRSNIITFDPSFMLLLAKIDLDSEEQRFKVNAFRIYGFMHIKIIFALLTKVVALYL